MSQQVGPYRLLSRLGRGGMATTYLAERTTEGGVTQRVCLKRMRADDDPAWPAMFRNEARTVAMLHHANIVSLHDFGSDGGAWWMALELVEGADLGVMLRGLRERESPVPVVVVAHVAAEVAKALAYAHARPTPVVHRDVSPSNILVSEEGSVRLTDFGVAKVAHNERTRTGQLRGKTPYMAPEQVAQRDVDGRTDLFALGVVMFEMLAGQRPFDGKTDLATQLHIAEGKRPDVRALRPDVPEPMATMIDRLLEVRPERRFPTADALLDALSELAVPANVVRVLGTMAKDARGGR